MEHKVGNELPPLATGNEAASTVPSPEQQGQGSDTEIQAAKSVETGSSQPAGDPAVHQAVIAGLAQASQSASTPAPLGNTQTPIIADDNDLIEKEWVLKAKEIVAKTRQDPYQQNKEVERIKADYMKKRYNKDVKVTDD